MNETPLGTSADSHQLSRSLLPRHVTMIAIGGIIGAGLFVGSSAAIAGAGPAILITYALTGFLVLLIMRMLGEMAVASPTSARSPSSRAWASETGRDFPSAGFTGSSGWSSFPSRRSPAR